jgi:hypothetical protein
VRKVLIAIVAFVASAIAGVILSILVAMALGYIWTLFYTRKHPGFGAVAGSISEVSVMFPSCGESSEHSSFSTASIAEKPNIGARLSLS